MDNLISNQINTPNNSTVEFFLSSEQQRIINELLPKGYSLQFASKPARSKSGSFTKTAFARQNDGQLRNSNGQFAPSAKPGKKYGGAKNISAQDNYGIPQPGYQGMNMGQQGYITLQNNGSNPGNNGMMTPQLVSSASMPNVQQQSMYSQLPQLNLNGSQSQISMQLGQSASMGQQQFQNNTQQQQGLSSQQQQQQQSQQSNSNQQQSQQVQQGGMMYGQAPNNGDFYQMQQQQNMQQQQLMNPQQYQMQMNQQMQMNYQLQQQNMYEQPIIHMKPTGQRKNAAAKPRKEKKLKQNEKAQKPNKRKNDGTLIAKGTKKSRAAIVQAAAEQMGYGGMSPEEQKKCLHILHSLQKHKSSFPFLRPVDPIKQGCPDYYLVIREPMDLSTVEKNLKSHLYQTATQFAADVHKIWKNSLIYNNRDSPIYNMTLEMEKYFTKKFKEIETNIYIGKDGPSTEGLVGLLTTLLNKGKGNKKKIPAVNTPTQVSRSPAPQPVKKAKNPASKMDLPMTMQEKKNLGQNILLLPPECLRGVWDIVQSDGNQLNDEKVLTFDIDALSVRKTRELEQYVKHNMAANNKRISKKQAKIQEKAMNAENKLIQNSTFGQDDETAATHHETALGQDMTEQRTMQHNQQYQVPMHPSQYPMDQMHTQTLGSYANGQNDYANLHDPKNQGMNDQGDMNEIDSDSSAMSDNSDSLN